MDYSNLFKPKKKEKIIKTTPVVVPSVQVKEKDIKPAKRIFPKNKKKLNLFKMGAKIPKKLGMRIEIFGIFMFFLTWFVLTIPVTKYDDVFQEDIVTGLVVDPSILPSPQAVIMSYETLVVDRDLLTHTWISSYKFKPFFDSSISRTSFIRTIRIIII